MPVPKGAHPVTAGVPGLSTLLLTWWGWAEGCHGTFNANGTPGRNMPGVLSLRHDPRRVQRRSAVRPSYCVDMAEWRAIEDVTPPWATGESDEVTNARTYARDVLYGCMELFRQLLVPTSLPRHNRAEHLLNAFSTETLEALVSLCERLGKTLFASPENFVYDEQNVTRYLIEYCPLSRTKELAEFLSMAMAEDSGSETSTQTVVVEFFQEWISKFIESLDDLVLSGRNLPLVLSGSSKYVPLSDSERNAIRRWRNQIEDALSSFTQSRQIGEAVRVANQAAERATHSQDVAAEAAGNAGAATLGHHFSTVADSQGRNALGWTSFAFICVAAILYIGNEIVQNAVGSEWIQTLLHLAIVLPIVGAASYAARIAGHHRELARWAKTAAVQINTVSAFAEKLSTESARENLILTLGTNIFSAHVISDGRGDKISTLPPELLEALKELVRKVPNQP